MGLLNHAVVDRICEGLQMERPAIGTAAGDRLLDVADEITALVWQRSQWYNGCSHDTCAYWDELPEGRGFGCIPAIMYEVTGKYPIANWDCPCFEAIDGNDGAV